MKEKDVLFLAIATLVTALAWVVFDAYHAYTTSTISKELDDITLPITPIIDTNIVTDIKKRSEPVYYINQVSPTPVSVLATKSATTKR